MGVSADSASLESTGVHGRGDAGSAWLTVEAASASQLIGIQIICKSDLRWHAEMMDLILNDCRGQVQPASRGTLQAEVGCECIPCIVTTIMHDIIYHISP